MAADTTAATGTASSSSQPQPPIEVAVFWDYENTPLPRTVRPAEAAKAIQHAAEHLPSVLRASGSGGRGRCQVKMRRVYYDPQKSRGNKPADPSGLDSSGFDLVSTPSRNMKETVDKKLIVDLLTFAWEVRERGGRPLVVLITSDGDYSYALAKLNDRGVMNAVMYGRDESTASILTEIAQDSLSFEREVLAVAGGGDSGSGAAAATTAASASAPQHQQQQQQHGSQLQNQSVPLPPASNDWLQQRGTTEPMHVSQSEPPTTGTTSTADATPTTTTTTTSCNKNANADRHVFLSQLPKSIDAKEVYQFLTATHGMAIKQVSMEILQKDPTGRTRFAHVICSNDHDADRLIALSKEKRLVLVYRDSNECISAIDDAKPPSAARLRKLPSSLIYPSRDPNEESYMNSSSSINSHVDDNVVALCVCLSTKQKSWGFHKNMAEDVCWVPQNIVQRAFLPHGDEEEGGMLDIFQAVHDRAIATGFVETARHRLRNKDSYVPIDLKEPTSNLSDMHYLRLTASGRDCAEAITEAEVESFCSALFRKQRTWSSGTRVPVEKCWIPMAVMEELYEPAFPLKDDKGVSYQCRLTQDAAIASDYLQKARKDLQSDKNDFIVREMWDSCETGQLSDELYFQLTAAGRRLAAKSLASTKRPSDKRR